MVQKSAVENARNELIVSIVMVGLCILLIVLSFYGGLHWLWTGAFILMLMGSLWLVPISVRKWRRERSRN